MEFGWMIPSYTRREVLRVAGLASVSPFSSGIGSGRCAEPPATEDRTTAVGDFDPFPEKVRDRARTLGETVQKSVVRISTDSGGGTGWIIDSGYILTNSHVVQEAPSVAIETFDNRTGMATRVGFHRDFFPDIALLKTDLETPTPLSLARNTHSSPNDVLLAVGHPKMVGNWVISLGRYDCYNPHSDWIEATIPIGDGNSGSPLLTMDGDVIGCVNGTTRENHAIARENRPKTVYTAFPRRLTVATATPADTITKWVSRWR
ncbi:Trypsin-like peptidase domain-containing protein [Haladaptatus litoreus]|uniref:Trypsin-like peptidase domain-containing protein n=1 Tax=Haladaptatus litoreus TaxID=553468 RepID=A0A1N7D1G1_9EURY|nr:Trypsin-like peptidase domain-containing protein [Haladaptatus litoreus]